MLRVPWANPESAPRADGRMGGQQFRDPLRTRRTAPDTERR